MTAPEDELQQGHDARRQGRLDDAVEIYLGVIENDDPGVAPLAELYMGVVRQAQGDNQAARGHYGTAIGSGHPEAGLLARFNLAKVSEGEGEYDWAIHYFKEVVDLPEPHPWATPWAAHNVAVLLWQQQEAWLVGKAYMEQALQLGEQHGNAEVVTRAEQALGALPD